MKVIKEGNTERRIFCTFCNSILEYDFSKDVSILGGYPKIKCPVCGEIIFIDDTEGGYYESN